MLFLGILLALMVVAAGLLSYRRLERWRSDVEPRLSDEMIRRIEQEGRLEFDDPLDWDEIRAEEEEFWGETWDEPEEL